MTTAVKRITPCPSGFSDHVFKVEHGVEMSLRVWPAPKEKKNAPWLLWFHGGGFIAGKHVIPNAWVYEAFQQYGYHIVSPAYRFIPQVSFDDIVQDAKDSLAWCIKNLPGVVGADTIDIERYVVAGDSAGGTLSTYSGHVLRPRPKAVINVFGVVDVPTLQQEQRKNEGDDLGLTEGWSSQYEDAEGELKKAKMDRDPANAEIICPWYWEHPDQMDPEDLRSFWGMPEFTIQDKDYRRMDLLKYLLIKDELFDSLYRKDTFGTAEEYNAYIKSVSPHHMLDKYPDYPPTFVLHGTGDTAVPVEQSYKFAEKLRELKVPVDERYKEGGEHCFENKIERPGDEGWDEFIVPCMDFVDKHVRK